MDEKLAQMAKKWRKLIENHKDENRLEFWKKNKKKLDKKLTWMTEKC